MASSRKRSSSSAAALSRRVAEGLAGVLQPGDRLSVGLSGGVDSVVLLDVLQSFCAGARVRLVALHVNHQLSRNAARWAAFCARLCRARGIPFRSEKVTVRRGDSVEAAARAARYAVFARQRCDHIALAQHRDDQVETVLLQLLRGAGVKGLAAMPLVRIEDRGTGIEGSTRRRRPDRLNPQSSILNPKILRPLLDITRQEILAYAKERRLRWVEDESNADVHFARNFLRREVLPVLARRFPAYRATIARAARHFSDAAQLLDELAALDASGRIRQGTLEIAALRRLSAPRARNLLRYFIGYHGLAMPNAERLDEALRQLLGVRRDARVAIAMGDFDLRTFEARVHVVARLPLPTGRAWRWQGERELALPELGGILTMTPARGRGISLARLAGGPVAIRMRRGGERMQPDCRRPRRTLKNLLQEAGVPPWQRERLPLVCCGSALVWTPCAGLDCAYQAGPGERSVVPSWQPMPAPRAL